MLSQEPSHSNHQDMFREEVHKLLPGYNSQVLKSCCRCFKECFLMRKRFSNASFKFLPLKRESNFGPSFKMFRTFVRPLCTAAGTAGFQLPPTDAKPECSRAYHVAQRVTPSSFLRASEICRSTLISEQGAANARSAWACKPAAPEVAAMVHAGGTRDCLPRAEGNRYWTAIVNKDKAALPSKAAGSLEKKLRKMKGLSEGDSRNVHQEPRMLPGTFGIVTFTVEREGCQSPAYVMEFQKGWTLFMCVTLTS